MIEKKLLYFFTFIFAFNVNAQNLIRNNGSFENAFEGWYNSKRKIKGKSSTAQFSLVKSGQDNSPCAKIKIYKLLDSKDPMLVFMRKHIGPMKRKKTYKLSFWVKSKTKEDNVAVSIFSAKGTTSKLPWAVAFSKQFRFKGNGEWQKIETTFVATTIKGKKFDAAHAGIKIGFGDHTGTTYFDNLVIEEKQNY